MNFKKLFGRNVVFVGAMLFSTTCLAQSATETEQQYLTKTDSYNLINQRSDQEYVFLMRHILDVKIKDDKALKELWDTGKDRIINTLLKTRGKTLDDNFVSIVTSYLVLAIIAGVFEGTSAAKLTLLSGVLVVAACRVGPSPKINVGNEFTVTVTLMRLVEGLFQYAYMAEKQRLNPYTKLSFESVANIKLAANLLLCVWFITKRMNMTSDLNKILSEIELCENQEDFKWALERNLDKLKFFIVRWKADA